MSETPAAAALESPESIIPSDSLQYRTPFIESSNDKYSLGVLDGKLTLSTSTNRVIWSVGSSRHRPQYFRVAPSGNVVLFGRASGLRTDTSVLWESNTKGNDGAYLELKNDGELRIRTDNKVVKVLSPADPNPNGLGYKCDGKEATIVSDDASIRGTSGPDVIVVLNKSGAGKKIVSLGGNDTICGNDYDNEIYGSGGDDVLRGNGGNDLLKGERGNDKLVGHSGNDKLVGNWGNDSLFGSEGDDRLFGSSGNDYLDGESGNDYLDGESDYDTSGDNSGRNTYVSIEKRS